MSNGQPATLLGKQELLQWACHHSAVPQCTRYDDLKDGFVFLCLAEKLWPALIDAAVIRNQRRGNRTTRLNWELLRSVMSSVGLPIHLCDPKGVAAGHQRPCYNLLVLYYFLSKLATTSEFSVDFAHPIDEVLAEFLQSTQSIQCLAKGQHTAAASQPADKTGGHLHSHHPGGGGDNSPGVAGGHGGSSGSRSVSPAHPAPSPNRRAPPMATPRPHGGGGGNSNVTTPRGGNTGTTYDDDISFLSAAGGTPAAARMAVASAGLPQHARKAKELLEQELAHVKLMSKHMLEQQRMLVEAEMARTTSQFQSHLATTRMELEFEAEQTILAVKAAYDRTLDDIALERNANRTDGNIDQEVVSLRQANAVLLGKLQAMDEAVERSSRQAAQWKEALDQTRGQQDRVLAALQASALRNVQVLSASAATDERSPLMMELNDRLTAAEKAPVIGFLRHCQMEAKAYKLQAERLEEEKKAWLASTSAPRGDGVLDSAYRGGNIGHTDGAAAAAAHADPAARLQVQRLSKVNALLHEQLGLVRRSGGGVGEEMSKVLQTTDARAEVLPGGASIPSTWLGGASSVEVVSASALERIKLILAAQQGRGGGGGEASHADADAVMSIFWSLVATAQVMQTRLRNCGATVRELSNALSASQRQLIVERHRHSKELREQTDALREELRQNNASARRAASDAELDTKLIRDELAVARRDLPQAFARFQAVTAEVLEECGRLMSGPQERSKALTRQNLQLRSRDQQWQQAVELLLATGSTKSPVERLSAEQQAQRILEQLRSSAPTTSGTYDLMGGGDAGRGEDSEAIRGALRRVDENVSQAMRAAMGHLQQSQLLSDELRRVSKELAEAKAEVELRRAVEEAAQKECQFLRNAAAETSDAVARLRASEDALQAALSASHREEQKNVEETLQYLATTAAGGGARSIGGLPTLVAAASPPTMIAARTQLHPDPVLGQQQQQHNYGKNGEDVINTVREWVTSASTYNSTGKPKDTPQTAAALTTVASGSSSVGGAVASAAGHHQQQQQWGSAHEPSEAGSSQPPLSQRTASVLTPEELERRKEEILLKYGVRGTASNK